MVNEKCISKVGRPYRTILSFTFIYYFFIVNHPTFNNLVSNPCSQETSQYKINFFFSDLIIIRSMLKGVIVLAVSMGEF